VREKQTAVFVVLFWAAIAAILSFMLVYPFGYDQYVFAVGGEKLVQEGAMPFRDVMDTKPMLIMYIYGWASAMFGHAMYSIRTFDVLYHLVALYVYFLLLRKYFINESVAYITIGIYVLLYVSTGPASTAQAESFALLPTLGILFAAKKIEEVQKKRDVLLLTLLTSVCAFALFTLKITLIIIPFTLCLWMIIDKPEKRKLHILHFVGMAAGLATLITCMVVWLSINDALLFAKEYITWLLGYTSNSDALNRITIYKDHYLEFTNRLTDTTPLSILVFSIVGVFVSILQSHHYWRIKQHTLFIIGFVAGITHLILANKYIAYQYGLFWWIFSPFAALGVFAFSQWTSIFIRERKYRTLRVILSIAIAGAILFFSPILPIYKHLDKTAPLDKVDSNDFMDFFKPKVNAESDFDTLQTKLLPLLKDEDNIFLFGHHVGVYYKLNKLPTTMMLTSAFLTASWTPDTWKRSVVSELQKNKPSYILVEMDDAIPITNQSTLSSREHFENWKEMVDFTTSNYDAVDSTSKFIIYRKRN